MKFIQDFESRSGKEVIIKHKININEEKKKRRKKRRRRRRRRRRRIIKTEEKINKDKNQSKKYDIVLMK